jgi:hypothetical protein
MVFDSETESYDTQTFFLRRWVVQGEGFVRRLKHTKFSNGFEVAELQRSQEPDAPQAKPGKRVSVKYEGKLQSNGKVFDKTKGNKTFSFRLGESQPKLLRALLDRPSSGALHTGLCYCLESADRDAYSCLHWLYCHIPSG